MFGLSFGEMLVLGVMALILIGPKQLPEVARNVGRFLNDLKRATEGLTDDLKKQAKVEFDLHDKRLPPVVPPTAEPVKEDLVSSDPHYPPAPEAAAMPSTAVEFSGPASEKKDKPS